MANALSKPRQSSLFDIDSPLHGKMRGERTMMDFPFFVLSKNAQMKPIEYNHEGVVIQVRPSSTGIATMYDKEIVLYAASLTVQAIADGREADAEITFTAHDFFRITGVLRPSKRDYARFSDALERLQGTQIKTNLETGSKIDRGWFSWLSEAQAEYDRLPNGDEQLRVVKVRLCPWLFRAIERDGRIYDYHYDYFKLGTVERRLYEIAHCYCENGGMDIPLEDLQLKVGATCAPKQFKQLLRGIEADDRLPQYRIAVHDQVDEGGREDSLGRRISKVRTIVSLAPRDQRVSQHNTLGTLFTSPSKRRLSAALNS